MVITEGSQTIRIIKFSGSGFLTKLLLMRELGLGRERRETEKYCFNSFPNTHINKFGALLANAFLALHLLAK